MENTSFTDRDALLRSIQQGDDNWDMVIVGGGIIGAGILREAVRRGLKVLLIEQKDFSWGTSSRSSKMIHGGLRYITHGAIKLTRDSLQERERLLREAPGLIERLGYFFTLNKGQFPGRIPFNILLSFYDWLAGIKNHRYFDRVSLGKLFPGIGGEKLKGGMYYTDTAVDDSRLVLRVLQDAIAKGGCALNYVKAESLVKTADQVSGIVIKDVESGKQLEVRCKSVINATGAWADRLRNEVNPEKRIRPLRGSHLVIPAERLPVRDALTLFHPEDKRPVFIFPWEGTTVIGTTDLDHERELDQEPTISETELNYLLAAAHNLFPDHGLSREDVISTWSGVRPVIASDKGIHPSKERRDHAVWYDSGLVTVSGGKLTTFRLIALDAIQEATRTLGELELKEEDDRVFSAPEFSADEVGAANREWGQRLLGRYGHHAKALLEQAPEAERQPVENTEYCLAECRWAARNESVVHLDDLLLRRTRFGQLLARGGESLFPAVEEICAQELQWDTARWQSELTRYRDIWTRYYSLPDT